ncbi:MAG TPA: phosphoribosyl-AMP cyclohydrolase [Planctomycetaceae bacterium]
MPAESSTTSVAFADRGDKKLIEEGTALAPKFDDRGLIPVVTTDVHTGELLMQAWMNREALARTIELGEAVYWSRSRNELWHKGATSGHVQVVRELRVDCDQDAIWLRVEQRGGAACHVGYRSCFYRRVPVGDEAREKGTGLVFVETEKAYDPEKVYGKK